MSQVYKGFVKDYPVVTIEDPFDQVAPRPERENRICFF